MTWRAWPKIHFGLGFVRRWLKVHFAAAHILLKFSLYRLDDHCTCFGFVLFAWSAAKGPWNVCTMISSTRSWEYILFWRLGLSARSSIIVHQPHSPIWLHMDAPCLSVWDWHMSRFALRTHNAFGVDEVTFGKIFGWHIDLQSGDDGRRILNLASAARWYAGGVLWRPALAWTPVNHFIDLLFAYLGPHLARCWVHLRCFAVKVRLVQCPPTVRSKTRVWTIRSSWDLAVISTVGLAVVISIETRFCYNVPRNLDSRRVRSDSGAESLHNRRQLQKVWFNRDTGANSQM